LTFQVRTFDVPPELEAVFEEDHQLAELYLKMSPSLRRAEKARAGIRDKPHPTQ